MEDANSVAASSPAAPTIPTDSAGYAEWRMTGKTPQPEASAPSKKESSGADGTSAESTPAPEAGKQQQEKKTRGNAETRLDEILGDLKRAGLSPAELKTYKREAQKEAQKAASEPKAVPEPTAKPAGQDEPPKKPKQDDFDTWDKYEAARDEYQEKLAEYKANKAVDDFRRQQAAEKTRGELRKKLEDARARYGDEAQPTIIDSAKAIFSDNEVSPAVKAMLDQSDVLTDVLYTLGSKAGDIEAFVDLAKSNPGQAIRKLVLVENLVKEELGKPASGKTPEKTAAKAAAPERDESGKFTPPAKKVTEAPPPPREASGHAGPPADEVESAAKAGDFLRFRDAANRKDLARRRGQ